MRAVCLLLALLAVSAAGLGRDDTALEAATVDSRLPRRHIGRSGRWLPTKSHFPFKSPSVPAPTTNGAHAEGLGSCRQDVLSALADTWVNIAILNSLADPKDTDVAELIAYFKRHTDLSSQHLMNDHQARNFLVIATTRCGMTCLSLLPIMADQSVNLYEQQNGGNGGHDLAALSQYLSLPKQDNQIVQVLLNFEFPNNTVSDHVFLIHKVNLDEVYLYMSWKSDFHLIRWLQSPHGKRKWSVAELMRNFQVLNDHTVTEKHNAERLYAWTEIFGMKIDAYLTKAYFSGSHPAKSCDQIHNIIRDALAGSDTDVNVGQIATFLHGLKPTDPLFQFLDQGFPTTDPIQLRL